jgi:hypothetical protein
MQTVTVDGVLREDFNIVSQVCALHCFCVQKHVIGFYSQTGKYKEYVAVTHRNTYLPR